MTLTDLQRKSRITLSTDKRKNAIAVKLRESCTECGISYNESDTNAELCEKFNNH